MGAKPFDHPVARFVVVLGAIALLLPFIALSVTAFGFSSLASEGPSFLEALKVLFQGHRLNQLATIFFRSISVSLITTCLAVVLSYTLVVLKTRRRSLLLSLGLLAPLLMNSVCRVYGWRELFALVPNLSYGETAIQIAIVSSCLPFAVFCLYYGLPHQSRVLFRQLLDTDVTFVGRFFVAFVPLIARSAICCCFTIFALCLGATVEAGLLSVQAVSLGAMFSELFTGQQFMVSTALALIVLLFLSISLLLLFLFLDPARSKKRQSANASHKATKSSLIDRLEAISQIEVSLINHVTSYTNVDKCSRSLLWLLLAVAISLAYMPLLLVSLKSLGILTSTGLQLADFTLRPYAQLFAKEELRTILLHTVVISGITGVFTTTLAFAFGSFLWQPRIMKYLIFITALVALLPGEASSIAWCQTAKLFSMKNSSWGLYGLSVIGWVLPFSLAAVVVANSFVDKRFSSIALEFGRSRSYAFFCLLPRLAMGGIVGSLVTAFILTTSEYVRSTFLTSEPLLTRFIFGRMKSGADASAYAIGTILMMFGILGLIAVHFVLVQRLSKNRLIK